MPSASVNRLTGTPHAPSTAPNTSARRVFSTSGGLAPIRADRQSRCGALVAPSPQPADVVSTRNVPPLAVRISFFNPASGSSAPPPPPSCGMGKTWPTTPPASSPNRCSRLAANVPVARRPLQWTYAQPRAGRVHGVAGVDHLRGGYEPGDIPGRSEQVQPVKTIAVPATVRGRPTIRTGSA